MDVLINGCINDLYENVEKWKKKHKNFTYKGKNKRI